MGPATLSGVAVETDDTSGLARKIAPVWIGGRLEPALPGLLGGGSSDPLLDAFAQSLDEVLGSVLLLGAEAETVAELSEISGETPSPLERGEIERLSRKLRALLEADNLNALGVWDELKPLLPAEAAGRLDPALQELDFREGSRILLDLAQALEIPL